MSLLPADRFGILGFIQPVNGFQARDTPKLALVVSDDGEVMGRGNAGDDEITFADGFGLEGHP